MKTLFIPAIKKNLDIQLPKSEIKKLPKKLLLLYSIQYKTLTKSIKSQLEKANIKVLKTQQILGCSKINTTLPILLITTGKFHALNLYTQSSAIYLLYNNAIKKISNKEINKLKTQRKTALLKFLSANKIGILVSTKPGQQNLKKAISIKKQLLKKHKQPYIFISNNIDINQFENFQIDSWINTACPGLAYDNPSIINIDELPKIIININRLGKPNQT